MAIMIPNINPLSIDNNGERAFYTSASKLSNEYTVLYSYKYKDLGASDFDAQIREADFIIVHPCLGFLVIEVKQGEISYNNGTWFEFKGNEYRQMMKDPMEQVKKAMFTVLKMYSAKAKSERFPLCMRFALAFPECSKLIGCLPSELTESSIFLSNDLGNIEKKVIEVFDIKQKVRDQEATDILINKVLAPTFTVFSKLNDKIEMFYKETQTILSEEQERILEETELDTRKIYLGAAGTGKTIIAKAKAKRLANQGKKVFLTCFNEELAHYELSELSPEVTVSSFHLFLEDSLAMYEYRPLKPNLDEIDAIRKYYAEDLPNTAFEFFANYPEEQKFDAIIVDEGQDFRQDWITCLEAMLKKNGEFYIFADTNQNLFNTDIESFKKFSISKHKLTVNYRNTADINEWINTLIPSINVKSTKLLSKVGYPVKCFSWQTYEDEKKLIIDEIGRLISQGLQPKRITILSPRKKEWSSLAAIERIRDWALVDFRRSKGNGIKFDTIRSFKGLESDIVFLIDVVNNSKACTIEDIYVGASRARFLLYIFHENTWNPHIGRSEVNIK